MSRSTTLALVVLTGGLLHPAHSSDLVPTENVPEAAVEDMDEVAEESAAPIAWKPERMRCRHRGPRHYCDGPRRVPVPSGADGERARQLGLGTPGAVATVHRGRASADWLGAAGSGGDGALLWPVEGGKLSRGFGYVRRREIRHRRHNGVDIAAPTGSEVRVAAGGLVIYADNGIRGFGNFVVVLHGDGSNSSYAHLESALVFPGQRVERGTVIGTVGSTGLSRGAHLHFEWREGGEAKDPLPRLVGGPGNALASSDAESAQLGEV